MSSSRHSLPRSARPALAGSFGWLVFLAQFWTVKAGFLSLAMLSFIVLSLMKFDARKLPKLAYLLGAAALTSYAVSDLPPHPDTFHYSIWFVLSGLLILACWVNWTVSLRDYAPGPRLSAPLLAAIVVCLLGIAALTPSAFVEQVDGPVGFFNEKGLAGYYIASVSCLLFAVRRDLFGLIVFCVCGYLTLVVLESGRSLLFYAATGLLMLQYASPRWRLGVLIGAIVAAALIVNTEFFAGQLYKLDLISVGEGGLGRYAAAKIVSDMSWSELLGGHGFGSYLAYRADLIPLPDGLDYDYGGSLWLELVFEIGIVGSLAVAALLSRLVFRRFSLIGILVVILVGTIGVKHDVQMLTAFLCAQVIAQELALRARRSQPVPRAAQSRLAKSW